MDAARHPHVALGLIRSGAGAMQWETTFKAHRGRVADGKGRVAALHIGVRGNLRESPLF